MRRLTIIATLCAAVLTGLLAASTAGASSKQLTIMQDDGLLYRGDTATRDAALDEMAALGADVIKVQVHWDEVAPDPFSRRRPDFDATDPGAPGYNWSVYDALVVEIAAHGMRPFLSIGNRAPDWATAKRSRHAGTYRPKSADFQRFAQAVGARYSGTYLGLPRVDIWSIWNEPNLFSWLSPQRKRGVPLSPSLYRGLYLAGHRGLGASGHTGDTILLGELMPLGAGDARKVPPLEFLRELACLNSRYRPYRGKAATDRGCPRNGKLSRIPTSGVAYHPYTRQGGVRAAVKKDEAAIGSLGSLTRTLDRIAGRGRLPRRTPVWITEFGFQTRPPDPFQYALRQVPGFLDESEWITFRNRRVRSYSQYTLRDEAPGPGSVLSKWSTYQMGLRFHDGRPKPGIYDAFRMPAFVRVLGGNRVEVFGGLRNRSGLTATVAARRGKKGRYQQLGTAKLSSSGYFRKVFRTSSPKLKSYRITIDGRSRTKLP